MEKGHVNIDVLIWEDIFDVYAKKDMNLNRTKEVVKEFYLNVISRK